LWRKGEVTAKVRHGHLDTWSNTAQCALVATRETSCLTEAVNLPSSIAFAERREEC
jgi:hypothetical protein